MINDRARVYIIYTLLAHDDDRSSHLGIASVETSRARPGAEGISATIEEGGGGVGRGFMRRSRVTLISCWKDCRSSFRTKREKEKEAQRAVIEDNVSRQS